jgi:mono/diheme cytochrome c family protein
MSGAEASAPRSGAGSKFALAAIAAAMALASSYGLSLGLRQKEGKSSRQQPTPEDWFEVATPTSPARVAQGRSLFLSSCAHCHGADATGDEGPDLHNVEVSDRYISNIVIHGIKGEMPSFRKKLGRDEIGKLTAYIRSLN